MRTFDISGRAGLTLQFSGTLPNTVRTISPILLAPPSPHYIHFVNGVTGMLVNDTLTGQTSGATFKIINWFISAGTLAAGSAKGVMFLSAPTGTITLGENLRDATPALVCVAGSQVITIPGWHEGMEVRSAFLSIETNNVRATCCGMPATTNAGSPASFGLQLLPTDWFELREENNIRRLSFVNENTASTATITLALSF